MVAHPSSAQRANDKSRRKQGRNGTVHQPRDYNSVKSSDSTAAPQTFAPCERRGREAFRQNAEDTLISRCGVSTLWSVPVRGGRAWQHGCPRTGKCTLLIYTMRNGRFVCLSMHQLDDKACDSTRYQDIHHHHIQQVFPKPVMSASKRPVSLVPAPRRNDLTNTSNQP